ncbi:MAG: hypothetical protein V1787_03080 [Candidatus Micrarchaeota archaeon]
MEDAVKKPYSMRSERERHFESAVRSAKSRRFNVSNHAAERLDALVREAVRSSIPLVKTKKEPLRLQHVAHIVGFLSRELGVRRQDVRRHVRDLALNKKAGA